MDHSNTADKTMRSSRHGLAKQNTRTIISPFLLRLQPPPPLNTRLGSETSYATSLAHVLATVRL